MKDTRLFRFVLAVAAAFFMTSMAACGGGVTGTYSNATGLALLDLRSGGKATATMLGETTTCTYEVNEKKINLKCGRDKSVFLINEDGSLTGPGFIGVMKKSK